MPGSLQTFRFTFSQTVLGGEAQVWNVRNAIGQQEMMGLEPVVLPRRANERACVRARIVQNNLTESANYIVFHRKQQQRRRPSCQLAPGI